MKTIAIIGSGIIPDNIIKALKESDSDALIMVDDEKVESQLKAKGLNAQVQTHTLPYIAPKYVISPIAIHTVEELGIYPDGKTNRRERRKRERQHK